MTGAALLGRGAGGHAVGATGHCGRVDDGGATRGAGGVSGPLGG